MIIILDHIVSLPISDSLSLGTLAEAWKLALEYSIENNDKERATAALSAIENVYANNASFENKLYLTQMRVNYHRCFKNEKELALAYDDFYEANTKHKENEINKTTEALNVLMKFTHIQMEMEKAQRDGQRLQSVSMTDELTGLANRRGWREHLHKVIEESKSTNALIGLALLDLDYFKQYNDRYGHLMGDKLLCLVAKALQIDVSKYFPGRYGGDEFIIIYNGLDAKEIENMLDAVYANLQEAQKTSEFKDLLHISFSAGYIVADASLVDHESEILEQADQALYISKKTKRNCYHGATFILSKKQ